jgi:hypothetical protein
VNKSDIITFLNPQGIVTPPYINLYTVKKIYTTRYTQNLTEGVLSFFFPANFDTDSFQTFLIECSSGVSSIGTMKKMNYSRGEYRMGSLPAADWLADKFFSI